MIYLILFLIAAYVLIKAIYSSTQPIPHTQWKTVTEAFYTKNILLIKYQDYSFTEYLSTTDTQGNHVWRKMPSMKKVIDKDLYASLSASAATASRGGRCKVLPKLY